MLCLLTIRHLKPGAHERFAEAWTPERWHGRLVRAYHVRNQDDPDEVITFGFFDGTLEQLESSQRDAGYEDRRASIEPLVDEVIANGIYEVVHVLDREAAGQA